GMSPANKDSIEKFIAHCQIMGLSDARIIRYYYAFKYFNIFFEKDFNAAAKEDIEAVVAKINSKETWSPTTKHDMRVMLKRFYKWLYGKDEEYPPEVKWIKTKIKRTDKKLPNEGEEQIDCGGKCKPCPSACDDGVINGNEEGVDCGGDRCRICRTCVVDGVCDSNNGEWIDNCPQDCKGKNIGNNNPCVINKNCETDFGENDVTCPEDCLFTIRGFCIINKKCEPDFGETDSNCPEDC
ncbi:MAG: hypothetical protein AABY09_00860, partial [Nanoarchaeota archaeon]